MAPSREHQHEHAGEHGHDHGSSHGPGAHGHHHGDPFVWDPDEPEPDRGRGARYIAAGLIFIAIGALLWWWGSRLD